MNISPEKTIHSGALIDGATPMLCTTLDALRDSDFEEASELATFAPRVAQARGIANPWWGKAYIGQMLVSVCLWSTHQLRCALSREGDTNLYGPGGKPDQSHQIAGAGVFSKSSTGLGYTLRIRAIGSQLFVCGQSRQVYRFDWDGQNLAAGRWVDMAGPMRQPPMPAPPEDDSDLDALDAWLDANESVDFLDINGPAADDLYAVGDETWHWDGLNWQQLQLPTDEPLAALQVIDAGRIVMVGHNGTVLWGNARDGFRDLSTVDDNQNFTGVEWFNGRLFLASNLGLFTCDPASPRIEPYATTLVPDLQDTHQLEAKDGVLWSFGFKDLARFDGQRWTRVDHPDNPPIR